MIDVRKIGFAATFAGATTAAMLFAAATSPSTQAAGFANIAATAALADEEDRGDKDCSNPAGHERGWCKHGDENGNDGEHRHKHRKHHRRDGRYGNEANATINGTVVGVNGNIAQFRLDDGRTISVDEAGTPLNVGQHYSLSGCYRNSTFVVNCNGYGGNGNGSGYGQQQVSGTILSVSGNIVTLAALPPVRIDIGQAQANGRVYVSLTPAQHITAYGYNQNGTFFATSVR